MSLVHAVLRRGARSVAVLVTAVGLVAASAIAYADGIDISHWQGHVDWSKVRSDDVTFAFMKATEGSYYTDPTLRTNWRGAEKVGIYRAAYHFARPSRRTGSAASQARYFVSRAGTFHGTGDLPPVLDLEATGGLGPAALRTWVSTWLRTVERLTGRTPILYFSPYFWVDHLGNSTAFTRYPLWIAHYTSTAPMVPGGWPTWTFWQRTSSGHVDGIGGQVDMNRFHGSSAQLAALANTTGGSDDPAPGGPTVPAGAPTTLSIASGTTTVAVGAAATFTGELATQAPVTPAVGETVSLWARPLGSATWAEVAHATTDGEGRYTLTSTVPRSADYQARSADSASYAPLVSPPLRVTTAAAGRVGLDLRAPQQVVRRGHALMLYGHLTTDAGGLAGRRVTYYKRSSGGTWVRVGSSRSLPPTGWHSIVVHPRVSRTWKAVFSGAPGHAPRTSSRLRIRVR
jgi:GH25 family lysozyme M1 (1,4-beta-N-acetylmuramidase)